MHDLHVRERATADLGGNALDKLLVGVVRIAQVEGAFAHLDGEDEQEAQEGDPGDGDGRNLQAEHRAGIERARGQEERHGDEQAHGLFGHNLQRLTGRADLGVGAAGADAPPG